MAFAIIDVFFSGHLGIIFRNSLASALFRIEGLQAYTWSSSRWDARAQQMSYWELLGGTLEHCLKPRLMIISSGVTLAFANGIIIIQLGMVCLNKQFLCQSWNGPCRTSDLATAALFGGLLDLHAVQKQIEPIWTINPIAHHFSHFLTFLHLENS